MNEVKNMGRDDFDRISRIFTRTYPYEFAENGNSLSLLAQINENLKELVRIEKERHMREMLLEIKEYENKHKQ